MEYVKSLFQNIYGAIASMFRKSRWRRPTQCLLSCPACFNTFASTVDPNLCTLIQRRDIYAQKNLISRSIWVICIIWKIMWRWQKCCIRVNGHISQKRVYFFEWNHLHSNLYFKLVGIFVLQICIVYPQKYIRYIYECMYDKNIFEFTRHKII